MWWEASGDIKGEKSLMGKGWKYLGGKEGLEARENLLDYPESIYKNLREGMPGE